MRSIAVALLLMTVLPALALAGGIRDGSLSAYSNGTSIVVRWVSDDEAGVIGYMVERKAGRDGIFIPLTSPPLRAQGGGASYEYIDNSAFRVTDNVYQYRITALGINAVYYVSVQHSVSSVRRTWGSIKAMFR
jgi:hypothetical protein